MSERGRPGDGAVGDACVGCRMEKSSFSRFGGPYDWNGSHVGHERLEHRVLDGFGRESIGHIDLGADEKQDVLGDEVPGMLLVLQHVHIVLRLGIFHLIHLVLQLGEHRAKALQIAGVPRAALVVLRFDAL